MTPLPQAVLLDLDGTICDVFHGFDFGPTRTQLRSLLSGVGLAALADLPDLFEVPRRVVAWVPDDSAREGLLAEVDRCLTAAELAAIPAAPLVPGVEGAIEWLLTSKVDVAVVTNNSPAVVRRLAAHRLPGLRSVLVVGRDGQHPELLKPNPSPILSALAELGVDRSRAVMVGDSHADVEAARAAGCRMLGMGSRPHRWLRLVAVLGPESVVRDYDALRELLTAGPGGNA